MYVNSDCFQNGCKFGWMCVLLKCLCFEFWIVNMWALMCVDMCVWVYIFYVFPYWIYRFDLLEVSSLCVFLCYGGYCICDLVFQLCYEFVFLRLNFMGCVHVYDVIRSKFMFILGFNYVFFFHFFIKIDSFLIILNVDMAFFYIT